MEKMEESTYPQHYPVPPDPISSEKLEKILTTELMAWRMAESPLPEDPFITRQELFREFKFEDFDKVLEFMVKVGVGCNIFPHHPRWENVWTTLKVWLSTWDSSHIISYKDIMLARHMELIYSEFSPIKEVTRTEQRVKEEQNSFVDKMKKLIRDDNLEEAFAQISVYTAVNTEKKINNDLILLNQQYRRTRKSERNNLLDRDEINRELSRISMSLLEVLEELS